VLAAVFRRKKYLFLALPMGLVDALVPFADTIGLVKFELLIFGLSVITVIIAMVTTKKLYKLHTPISNTETRTHL